MAKRTKKQRDAASARMTLYWKRINAIAKAAGVSAAHVHVQVYLGEFDLSLVDKYSGTIRAPKRDQALALTYVRDRYASVVKKREQHRTELETERTTRAETKNASKECTRAERIAWVLELIVRCGGVENTERAFDQARRALETE